MTTETVAPGVAPPVTASATASGYDAPAFCPGGSFTVGVEEELMLVDGVGELLGDAGRPLVESLVGPLEVTGPGTGMVRGEVYVDQVELNSPVCADAGQVVASLSDLRAHVMAAGARLMAVGVHPTAILGAARTVPSPRYDAIVAEYAGLLRTPTAALQVHVGLSDTESAMRAYRGLRHRLPLLRALAATSPYWHGVDSGLASARSAVLRSYPRTTVPPLLHSWEEYEHRTAAVVAAAEVPDHTWVWWDLRPRPLLGTLEVRVMDAQPTLSRVAGLTALVQGIARRAVELPDPDDLIDDVAAVNDHRAMRHGLEARLVELDGTSRPMREVAVRELAQARAVLAGDGLDGPLDVVEEMLRETPEPERQRRLVDESGMPALLEDLATRTSDLDG